MSQPPWFTLFPYTTLFRSLIVSIEVPACAEGRASHYLKVRDRQSYEFALVSAAAAVEVDDGRIDRKSTRLNSSHTVSSYAVFCLKKKTKTSVTNKTSTCNN